MAQPVDGLTILPASVLGKISDYAGEVNLASVCRSFQAYVRGSMVRTGRELIFADRIQWKHNEKEASALLAQRKMTFEQLEAEFHERVDAALERDAAGPQEGPVHENFSFVLQTLRALRDRLPFINQGVHRWVTFFHTIGNRLENLGLHDEHAVGALNYLELRAPLKELLMIDFRKFQARFSIEQRFRAILQPQDSPRRDYEDHAQISGYLRELYSAQRKIACSFETTRDAFLESIAMPAAEEEEPGAAHPVSFHGSFGAQRFIAAEEQCRAIDIEQDRQLNRLWAQIPGAPVLNTTADRRAWLNSPAARPILQNIRSLDLFNFGLIPPEVRNFRGLTRLVSAANVDEDEVPPRLIDLPDELAEINLDQLMVIGGDFAKIPDVVARLNCSYIWFIGNHNPAVTISKKVASAHCSGLTSHFIEAILGMGIGNLFEYGEEQMWADEGSVPRFLGLERETIAELPFSLRFRDLFSIPYMRCITQATLDLIDWWGRIYARIGLGEVEAGLIGAPVLGFFVGLNILINVPIFLINLFTNWIIQPIVSLIRDLFGYSRMVRLQ